MDDQYKVIKRREDYYAGHEETHRQSLVEKVVECVDYSHNDHALRFVFDDGSYVIWDTEGDCCSESWWSDGYSVQSLIGALVFDVQRLYLEPLDDPARSRQEFDSAYGYEITHSKGKTTFVFRNSSNGYYGGWSFVTYEDDLDYDWQPITENDWRA